MGRTCHPTDSKIVQLILRLYRKGNSLVVLRSKIKQLPSELSGLYRELLESVDEEDSSESLLLMQWILFSLRPLKLSELRFALVTGLDISCKSVRECQSSRWFSSTDEDLKRKVLALSRGLVDVRELQGPFEDYHASDAQLCSDNLFGSLYRYAEGNLVVQFIHQSVKDFLLEGGLQLLDKGHLYNTIGRGHFSLSSSCIRYLTLVDVRHRAREAHGVYGSSWHRFIELVLPFLDYAAHFWHLHSAEVEKRDPTQAGLLSMIWRSSDTLTQTWIEVFQILRLTMALDSPKTDWSLLHVASRLNLPSVVSAILDRDVKVNLRVLGGKTPLSLAARAGNEKVVKILLARQDVDGNIQDDDGRTPLFHAVRSRRGSTLSLLLDQENIDPNLQDHSGDTPLYSAITSNDEDMVAILLQRSNVNANYRHPLIATPLSQATRGGVHFQAVVELLLDRMDIDPNAQDICGRTPLSYAAERGNEVFVKLLLDRKDIDPNAKDQSGSSPLSTATKFYCEGVVKLLLDRKEIDVNTQDFHGRTPLSYATFMGYNAIVELLLNQNDVDPSIQDDSGYTILAYAYATKYGPTRLKRMLLDRMQGTGVLGSQKTHINLRQPPECELTIRTNLQDCILQMRNESLAKRACKSLQSTKQ